MIIDPYVGLTTYTIRDPTVKRTLCRGCDTVLIPGLSATVRVNSAWFSTRIMILVQFSHNIDFLILGSNAHRHVITTTCLRCKSARRIPAPPVVDPGTVPGEDTVIEGDISGPSIPLKSRRRRGPPPRPPPLFEREGHVIFRGNVQIEPKRP